MKKYIIIICIFVIVLGIALFFIINNKNENFSNINKQNETEIANNVVIPPTPPAPSEPIIKETELAKSSTKILIDDANRNTNLKLTASKINNYVLKVGQEFSFNEVVGNPTPEKGYKKASIIVDGKKEKGYGGGNCQISSTLYNAVTKVHNLKVTERHEHEVDVGYIEKGKDATVVYDELDLKFKNNTSNDIKIYIDVSKEKVNVKIMKLEA